MDCEKCFMYDKISKEMGYQSGMCQECFDQRFVPFSAIYTPPTTHKEIIEFEKKKVKNVD